MALRKVELGIWNLEKSIIKFDSIESTHKFMRENFENLPICSVVIADYQTGGTGRHNRAWVAPKGKNLSFNILLPTENLKPKFYASTTQIAAITLAQILQEKGINASVKWPNDILANKKKICGIISELLYNFEIADQRNGHNALSNSSNERSAQSNGQRKLISLGIGLNVNTTFEDLANVDKSATSMLIESGCEWNRDEILNEFLDKFEKNFFLLCENGLQPFIDEWKKMGNFAGAKARIIEGDKILEGAIEKINDDGSLLFRVNDGSPNGSIQTIWSGDLEI